MVEASVVFAQAPHLETFGDSTWAWDESEIWRYSAGAWARFAAAPEGVGDMSFGSDTLLAITDSGFQYFDGTSWRLLDEPLPPPGAYRLAGTPTGVVWVSALVELYRWDGAVMTYVGHPPNHEVTGEGEGYVGEIAVTSDGTVWAGGLNPWVPWFGGLSSYDDDTGSWDVVRPLGGDSSVSAGLMAPASNGDLWVVLENWFEDWEARDAAGEATAEWVLARHDGATGEWTVFDRDLPGGIPTVLAAADDSVWIARGGGVAGFEGFGGMMQFDGETWTAYLADTPVEDVGDIAVAPDGTIWYSINGAVRRLDS